jgi:hypothetical protein
MGAYEYYAGSLDYDGDGMSNGDENLCHTDMMNPYSVFELHNINISNQRITLWWSSVAGKLYAVESTADLASGFTNTIEQHIPGTSPQNEYQVPALPGGHIHYYRVRLE